MMNETKFYTTADIRRILKIGNKKCLELFHHSDFPCVKFGKSFLITVDAFNNYVSSRRSEEEAINKALTEKLNIEKNGGIKLITKSDKSIIDLVQNIIEEDYKLGKIKDSTLKRKADTLKKLRKEPFSKAY